MYVTYSEGLLSEFLLSRNYGKTNLVLAEEKSATLPVSKRAAKINTVGTIKKPYKLTMLKHDSFLCIPNNVYVYFLAQTTTVCQLLNLMALSL